MPKFTVIASNLVPSTVTLTLPDPAIVVLLFVNDCLRSKLLLSFFAFDLQSIAVFSNANYAPVRDVRRQHDFRTCWLIKSVSYERLQVLLLHKLDHSTICLDAGTIRCDRSNFRSALTTTPTLREYGRTRKGSPIYAVRKAFKKPGESGSDRSDLESS